MFPKDSTHSIAQAAEKLGISRELCSKMVDLGQIETVEVGSRRRVTDAALKRVIASWSGDKAQAG